MQTSEEQSVENKVVEMVSTLMEKADELEKETKQSVPTFTDVKDNIKDIGKNFGHTGLSLMKGVGNTVSLAANLLGATFGLIGKVTRIKK